MLVKTTTLRMTQRPTSPPRLLPDGARIDRVEAPSPEYLRWLYAAVGGPWRWNDRLAWTREQWVQDLGRPGTEIHVLYVGGAPAGYVQLDVVAEGSGSSTEIVYFGLMEHAIGRGFGGLLLSYGIEMAWTLPDRRALAPAHQVWLHTCDLDGPKALANYQARGFEITTESTDEQDYPAEPLGAWVATGGPA